jgi:hypothetical protein
MKKKKENSLFESVGVVFALLYIVLGFFIILSPVLFALVFIFGLRKYKIRKEYINNWASDEERQSLVDIYLLYNKYVRQYNEIIEYADNNGIRIKNDGTYDERYANAYRLNEGKK